MKSKTKKLKGFTLAEILITLTLVGIVASLVLPSLQGIIPSTNKALYRKSYYNLQRAIDAMLDNEEIYPSSQVVKINGVLIPRRLNYREDPTGSSGTEDKFCYYLKQYLNVVSTDVCIQTNAPDGTKMKKFATTVDGVDWYLGAPYGDAQLFRMGPGHNYSAQIMVDLNGATEPNCTTDGASSSSWNYVLPDSHESLSSSLTTCPNPDSFILGVSYDGKLRLANSNEFYHYDVITDPVAADILKDAIDNKK